MGEPTAQLSRETRVRLFRFCCSMAWADFEVQPEERDYLHNLVERLDLSAGDRVRVLQWLKVPPAIDELDPNIVPSQHRQLFLDECRAIIEADGHVGEDEASIYSLFEKILFPERDRD